MCAKPFQNMFNACSVYVKRMVLNTPFSIKKIFELCTKRVFLHELGDKCECYFSIVIISNDICCFEITQFDKQTRAHTHSIVGVAASTIAPEIHLLIIDTK